MTDPIRLRRARWATRAQFLHLGIIAGLFGVHVPSVASAYALDARALAAALFASTIGSLIMLLLAGRIIARVGARGTAMIAGWAFCLALLLLLRLPVWWLVFPAMTLLGAGESLYDIAINAEGTMLELLGGQAVMSGFHAMFSVGAMIGAGAGALLFRLGVAPATQLLLVAVLIAVSLSVASRSMLPMHPSPEHAEAHFTWPRGALLLIGLLILLGMMAEGVMYHWSVLYVQQELGAPPQRAALAYVTFAGATALMRFAGDAVRARVPERRILVAGALLASGAMAGVLLVARPGVAMIGFAVVGVGLATIVPILYNAATRIPGVSRAAALASASSIGYVGFLLGPPLVGGIAHATSLTWAMGTLIVASLLLVLGTRRVPLAGV
jgi:MFS family permease